MLQNEIITVYGDNWLVREAVSKGAAEHAVNMARCNGTNRTTHTMNGAVTAEVVRLYKYHVHLTWLGGEWRGIVDAENMDAAIRSAKVEAGAPERTASSTQRV